MYSCFIISRIVKTFGGKNRCSQIGYYVCVDRVEAFPRGETHYLFGQHPAVHTLCDSKSHTHTKVTSK